MRAAARGGLALGVLLAGCAPDPGPIRDALKPDPSAPTQLRVLRSADRGASWTLDPSPIAHDLSSLHACTWEGTVWVTGLLAVREIPWTDELRRVLFVDVLRSTDGRAWTADRIPIDADATSAIDPACAVGPDGLELWFADLAGQSGDPAQGGRTARIWRTHWRDGRFGAGEVLHSGPGLVDPAPTWRDGQLQLFLNQDGVRIVESVPAAGGRAVRTAWDSVTVPQIAELGSTRWLLGQAPQGRGMLPVGRPLAPDGSLGAPFGLPLAGALPSCESPSLTTLGDTWLLFCVDASRAGPPR